MPKLQIFLPDGTENTHELGESEITIGRVADNVLQIVDNSVSSHHAVLTSADDGYILKDIGSTNGTRLNGVEIEPDTEHPLNPGDKIRFGQIETVYSSEVRSEARPLPKEEEITAVPAATSMRPSNFSNASPFQTKQKKKNPVGTAVMAFGIVALLIFGAAVFLIFQMKAPL